MNAAAVVAATVAASIALRSRGQAALPPPDWLIWALLVLLALGVVALIGWLVLLVRDKIC